MPYNPNNPDFTLPQGDDPTIWRYIDLARLVSMLRDQSVFFPRADTVGDTHEGSLSQPSVDARAEYFRAQGQPQVDATMHMLYEKARFRTYLSCWHVSEHESAAMWSIYSQKGFGVVIRSTVMHLINSIELDPNDIYVGQVNYIEYETTPIPIGNVYAPYVHKRKSFEHEKELRAVTMEHPTADGQLDLSYVGPVGMLVSVDIETLVQDLFVAPESGDWFRNVVQSTIERFGLAREVKRSSIDLGPLY